MAIIHQATLTPTKLELLAAWLPGHSWYPGGSAAGLERVAAARFDDPAGAVGVEIFLVRAPGGPLVQAPMTYRAAPLDGADEWLIGTTDHSVLGRRWVYDAVADPVFVAATVAAIRTGGREAAEVVETPDGPVTRAPMMTMRGSGSQPTGSTAEIIRVDDGDPAVVLTNVGELSVPRRPRATPPDAALTLTATWPGGSVTLAALS
jgi:Maltokinase N-terminal cap domain